MEYSIRFFINKHEEKTIEKIILWSKSQNYHVRRLASEGSRPKLPWGEKINLDYKKTIQILDNLYHDKTRYVTRSLANHLNDISKKDYELVLNTLKKWEIE
jgi:3-methyladenine DNA glycosylase AlkC